MKKIFILVAVVAMVACKKVDVGVPVNEIKSAKIIFLGTLDSSENYYSRANAVSDDGEVIVGSFAGSGPSPSYYNNAFYYKDGQMTNMNVYLNQQLALNTASDVSADGSLIVGTGKDAIMSDFENLGFRYSNGSPATYYPEYTSTILGVSADGSTAVGAIAIAKDNFGTAACWRNNVIDTLNKDLSSGSRAFASSEDGSKIVGFSYNAQTSKSNASVWSEGKVNFLEYSKEPYSSSSAHGISNNGSLIVGSINISDRSRAFIWREGVMSLLGDLEDVNAIGQIANDVSNDGRIVGSASVLKNEENFQSGKVAVMWNKNNEAISLQKFLSDELDLELNGWFLTEAVDITKDGSKIVGNAIKLKNGKIQSTGWYIEFI